MLTHFPQPGHGAGCDFCGVVVECAGDADMGPSPGVRVCGTAFPYAPVDDVDSDSDNNSHGRMGSFAEFVVVDSRLLLRVPDHWTDLQAAALGGVGWSTVAMAMSSSDALALPGLPSKPAETNAPVLVYGGGTATGSMAAQLLNLSGYAPICVTQSAASAALAQRYGAVGIARCHKVDLDDCLRAVRDLRADGPPLRHAMDCITNQESASLCFAALARTGGRYACLEAFPEVWRTRRVVKVKEVMGYEMLGRRVELGGPRSPYSRDVSEAAMEIRRCWVGEIQSLLDRDLIRAHPVQEITWESCPVTLAGEQPEVPREPGEPGELGKPRMRTWPQAVTHGLQMLMAGGQLLIQIPRGRSANITLDTQDKNYLPPPKMPTVNNWFVRFLENYVYAMPEPPPRKRTKPMEVLCVGLPRSGTESLQHALLRLGYDHTFHGWDIIYEQPNYCQWFGPLDGNTTFTADDFDPLIGHSVAVTDAAGSVFAAELIAAYPEAKVVLNYRKDLDAWHRSATTTLMRSNGHWPLFMLSCLSRECFWAWHVFVRFMWPGLFRALDGNIETGMARNGKWVYKEHVNMIRGLVPSERLLEWTVEDG
ncbi:hypothetical protein QQS21_004240 [Conoideocrella luteorostrata]|uniref:Uncharacterized protein n=1 Tax=Conoideocrella luteorostrata TaxID=1105319 RepID=A0AAJ0CUQ8_9HYPO|nr:hypothetical protein QQS21_004240 [Conoideocrella luteorostrata]